MTDKPDDTMVKSVLVLKTLLNLEKLVAGISHEMKSPIVAIKGLTEFIKNNCADGTIKDIDDFKKCIDMLEKSVESLSFTLGALINIKTATRDSSIENINVIDIIRQVVNMARLSDMYKKANNKIDFVVKCDYEECAYHGVDNMNKNGFGEIVHCDLYGCPFSIQTSPYILQSVLINLIENSIYSIEELDNKDDKHIKIIASKIDDNESRIDVVDNGKGISETMANKLFKPFVTERKPTGTGLGLFMSKIMIESVGGDIFLKHGDPGNTVFSVILNRNGNK